MPVQTISVGNHADDPRRPEKVRRYKAPEQSEPSGGTADYVNALGMVFSLVGLLMRVSSLSLLPQSSE